MYAVLLANASLALVRLTICEAGVAERQVLVRAGADEIVRQAGEAVHRVVEEGPNLARPYLADARHPVRRSVGEAQITARIRPRRQPVAVGFQGVGVGPVRAAHIRLGQVGAVSTICR